MVRKRYGGMMSLKHKRHIPHLYTSLHEPTILQRMRSYYCTFGKQIKPFRMLCQYIESIGIHNHWHLCTSKHTKQLVQSLCSSFSCPYTRPYTDSIVGHIFRFGERQTCPTHFARIMMKNGFGQRYLHYVVITTRDMYS